MLFLFVKFVTWMNYRKIFMIFINSLMPLEYEYDFLTDVIKLCLLFQYIIFKSSISFMNHFWPNLFGLTFKCNQSDFCMQLFLPKIAKWRVIHVHFMACFLNINEFRQVFSLSATIFEFMHSFINCLINFFLA